MQFHISPPTGPSRPRAARAGLSLAVALALLATAVPAFSRAKLSKQEGEAPSGGKRSLDDVFTSYQTLDLDLAQIARAAGSSGRLSLELQGATYELDLEATNLLSPDFRATLTTGRGVVEDTLPPAATYKGAVVGDPKSDVRLLISPGMLFGYIRTEHDWLFVDPASRYVPGAKAGQVVAYRKEDVRQEFAAACGAGELEGHAGDLARFGGAGREGSSNAAALPATPRVIEIATEADFEFFEAHPEAPNFVILGILNEVNGIYESQLGLTFSVSGMNAWATADDPYTVTEASELLGQFTDYWNANNDHVRRDVAHMFTARRLTGAVGIAFVGVVCNAPRNAYGLSRDVGAVTTVTVAAHELGHNLGAGHDDPSLCGVNGPIMCAFIQNPPNYFSEASKAAIANHVSLNNSCLSDVAEFRTTDGRGGMSFLRGYTNWRASWDIIVPGNFGGSSRTDLLFYDRNAGHGEFYTTDGFGGMTQLALHTDWRTTWDIIVPGNFGGDGRTDLLFYDRETGTGQFYETDGAGGISELATHTNWRGTWDLIVPGHFGGDFHTDLLFYDRDTGTGEFYKTDGSGGIAQLRLHTNWRWTWDIIVPGNFGGDFYTDLLFYDRETGFGEFYATDGGGGIWQLQAHDYWRTSWDMIVPGSFGGNSRTDLFFYDRNARQGEFHTSDGSGGIMHLRTHDGLRPTWYLILPGSFGGASPTDLLFYER